jgi:hypothetical protein
MSNAEGSLALRYYQIEAVDRIAFAVREKNVRSVAICIPTGGGLTVTALYAVNQLLEPGQKAAVVVNSTSEFPLVEDLLKRFFPNLPCECLTVERLRVDPNAYSDKDIFVFLSLRPAGRYLVKNQIHLPKNSISIFAEHVISGQDSSDFVFTISLQGLMMGGFLAKGTPVPEDLALARCQAKEDYVRSQVDELEKRIAALEAQNKSLIADKAKLQVYNDAKDKLLFEAGYLPEDLHKMTDAIGQAFEKIEANNFSAKDSDVFLQQVEEAKLEAMAKISENKITSCISDCYSTALEDSLTANVWSRFLKESQSDLILAKYTYDQMITLAENDSLDYSGVCLLLAKSLERELMLRIRDRYFAYLKEKYGDGFYSRLPSCVTKKWPSTKMPIQTWYDKWFGECCLGSIEPIIGWFSDHNSKNYQDFESFLSFASSILYRADERKTEGLLKGLCGSVYHINETYRIPSCHREYMKRVSAQDCFDYMVDVQKKMKEIFEPMAI